MERLGLRLPVSSNDQEHGQTYDVKNFLVQLDGIVHRWRRGGFPDDRSLREASTAVLRQVGPRIWSSVSGTPRPWLFEAGEIPQYPEDLEFSNPRHFQT